jgi:uncharacterized membrane protein YgcG
MNPCPSCKRTNGTHTINCRRRYTKSEDESYRAYNPVDPLVTAALVAMATDSSSDPSSVDTSSSDSWSGGGGDFSGGGASGDY